MMKLLAIDTSTDSLSLSVSLGDQVLSREQQGLRQQAQIILPLIDELLVEAGLTSNQLDAIVFGRGPGSFTGLRIAAAVAKGMAYAHDLPLFPVSSLASIAEDVFYQDETSTCDVLALMDARMNQLYWSFFSPDQADGVESVSDASIISGLSEGPLVIAGVGYEAYMDALPDKIKHQTLDQKIIFPNASAMIRLAMKGKVPAVSAEKALPVYIRNQLTQGVSHG